MIVRSAFKCMTCDQPHVVRIGMGQEEYQSHRFPCRGCGEEMVVALHVDYKNIGHRIEAVENAEVMERETPDALIVNVHANFVIPEAERFTDRSFPHLDQMHDELTAAIRDRSLIPVSDITKANAGSRPYRRPDFANEWKMLKKAWSLHSRNRAKLSNRQLAAAIDEFYANDPLKDIYDWVWRFAMFLGATEYQRRLMDVMSVVRSIDPNRMKPLLEHYGHEMAAVRARRYFEIIRDYFSAWDEFSQVHFSIGKGVPVDGKIVASSGFHGAKMFYGNAFEAFAASVDFLAFMNNVRCGREWNEFQTIPIETYLKSDKAARFDAFAGCPEFSALCEERDNQLRNASHHGSFNFNPETGLITYRTGKGNQGPEAQISYAEYLGRCSKLFFQAITLLRIELLICQATRTPYPV